MRRAAYKYLTRDQTDSDIKVWGRMPTRRTINTLDRGGGPVGSFYGKGTYPLLHMCHGTWVRTGLQRIEPGKIYRLDGVQVTDIDAADG